MTVTLELPPNVEARAVAEARARRVSVETVLKEAIAERVEDSIRGRVSCAAAL
jgi:hypothetical protein